MRPDELDRRLRERIDALGQLPARAESKQTVITPATCPFHIGPCADHARPQGSMPELLRRYRRAQSPPSIVPHLSRERPGDIKK